ncbi:PD-(D/E)XK motif protein [Enterococcus hirae]|nr:PD-(D/E)XK motif protein [Enterococcus hirae]
MKSNRIEQLSNTFQRVKDTSNSFSPQIKGSGVQLFAGVLDGDFAIAVAGEYHDISLKSTGLIKVFSRSVDEKPALVFALKEANLLDIFVSFAVDLEGLIQEDKDVTMVEIYNRFLYWQTMFKAEKGTISEPKIKGLINEISILNQYLIPKYGLIEAIRGWTGNEGMHKDFSYNDYWYEAKAVNLGKEVVAISSIEQLEAESEGQLLVSYLESTSSENKNGLSLMDLLSKLRNLLEYEDQAAELYNKIILSGLDLSVFTDEHHEANQYRYIIHGTDSFLVNEKFPRLEKEMLPDAIGKVSYQIILSKIENNKIDLK